MTWDASPPGMIAQLRTQIAACPTWTTMVGAGNETARIHYPQANPGGDNATADPVPLAVLQQNPQTSTRYAEGANGLLSGQLSITIMVPAYATTLYPSPYTAGQLETYAQALVKDLLGQTAGIPFTGATFDDAREPQPGTAETTTNTATHAFRSIKITLPYGYTP